MGAVAVGTLVIHSTHRLSTVGCRAWVSFTDSCHKSVQTIWYFYRQALPTLSTLQQEKLLQKVIAKMSPCSDAAPRLIDARNAGHALLTHQH